MPKLRAASAPKTSPIAVVIDDREHERERRVPPEREPLRLAAGAALVTMFPSR